METKGEIRATTFFQILAAHDWDKVIMLAVIAWVIVQGWRLWYGVSC